MCRRRSILAAKNKSVFLLEKTENGFSSPLKIWSRKKALIVNNRDSFIGGAWACLQPANGVSVSVQTGSFPGIQTELNVSI